MPQALYDTLVAAERVAPDISDLEFDIDRDQYFDVLTDQPKSSEIASQDNQAERTRITLRMAQQIFETPVQSLEACEEIPLKVRKNTIKQLIKTYSNNKYVLRKVSEASNKTECGYQRNTAVDMGNKMRMYNVPTPEAQTLYFKVIDEGLRTHLGTPDTSKLSEDEKTKALEKVLDLVAAHQIVLLSNQRFVYGRACRFHRDNDSVPLEDLVQEGNIGLEEAIRGFDVTKGYKFTTYAAPWVDRDIRTAYAYAGHSVRLPRDTHEVLMTIPRSVEQLTQELGRKPTDDEVASQVGMSMDTYEAMLQFGAGMSSLDEPLHDSDGEELTGLSIADTIGIKDETDNHFDQEITCTIVERIIDSSALSDRSRLVIGVEHDIDALRARHESCIRPDTGEPIDYEGLLTKIESGVKMDQNTVAGHFGIEARTYRLARTKGIIALRETACRLDINPVDLGFEPALDIAS